MTNLVLICDEQAELIAGGHRHKRDRGALVSFNFPELKSNDGGISLFIIVGDNNNNYTGKA